MYWSQKPFNELYEREFEDVTGKEWKEHITKSEFRKLFPRLGIVEKKLSPKECDQMYNHIMQSYVIPDVVHTQLCNNRCRSYLGDIKKRQWCKKNGYEYQPNQ